MKKYTIGIYFDQSMENVLLILKNRPEWQKGLYNFPGGHTENHESPRECIIREFNEECGIITSRDSWKYIGVINNEGDYRVDIYTSIQTPYHGSVKTKTDEVVTWFDIRHLPENKISNISWLLQFAINYWKQGNADNLVFGTFEYNNKTY